MSDTIPDPDPPAAPTPEQPRSESDALPATAATAGGATTPAPVRRGAEVIAEIVKRLPNGPGVYRMIDAKGDVLYVGKARSLKKRVVAYARPVNLSTRILRMVQATAVHGVRARRAPRPRRCCSKPTSSSGCARASTCCLRDDKSFPYILLTGDHASPADRQASRRPAQPQGRLFRPLCLGNGAVGRTINALQKAFLIRNVHRQPSTRSRSASLPAAPDQALLQAPCTGEIDHRKGYGELVRRSPKAFLTGRSASW
jgi:excinuclease ABC subunit C